MGLNINERSDNFELLMKADVPMRIVLHPNDVNPLHNADVTATYSNGYFYCDGTPPEEGPDYYWNDVTKYNGQFTLLDVLGPQ